MHIPIGTLWALARRVFMGRLDVRVRVHEAMLSAPYQADAFFINVTNHSPARSAKPTHVTVLTTPQIAVVNPIRPFRTLASNGDSWETWVEKQSLPNPNEDIRGLVQVRLSTGELIMSVPATPGIDVPLAGTVPE